MIDSCGTVHRVYECEKAYQCVHVFTNTGYQMRFLTTMSEIPCKTKKKYILNLFQL